MGSVFHRLIFCTHIVGIVSWCEFTDIIHLYLIYICDSLNFIDSSVAWLSQFSAVVVVVTVGC